MSSGFSMSTCKPRWTAAIPDRRAGRKGCQSRRDPSAGDRGIDSRLSNADAAVEPGEPLRLLEVPAVDGGDLDAGDLERGARVRVADAAGAKDADVDGGGHAVPLLAARGSLRISGAFEQSIAQQLSSVSDLAFPVRHRPAQRFHFLRSSGWRAAGGRGRRRGRGDPSAPSSPTLRSPSVSRAARRAGRCGSTSAPAAPRRRRATRCREARETIAASTLATLEVNARMPMRVVGRHHVVAGATDPVQPVADSGSEQSGAAGCRPGRPSTRSGSQSESAARRAPATDGTSRGCRSAARGPVAEPMVR